MVPSDQTATLPIAHRPIPRKIVNQKYSNAVSQKDALHCRKSQQRYVPRTAGPWHATAKAILMLCIIGATSAQVKITKNVHSDSAKAHFEVYGSISPASVTGHIYGEVNINNVVKTYNELIEKIDQGHLKVLSRPDSGSYDGKFQEILNSTFRQFHQAMREVQQEVEFTCDLTFCTQNIKQSKLSPKATMEDESIVSNEKIREIKRYISNNSMIAAREKRQIETLLSVAAIGISIYSVEETIKLKHDIHSNKKELFHLKSELRQQRLQEEENSKQVTAIRKEIDILVKFSNSAQHRLSYLLILECIGFYIRSVQRYIEGINNIIIQQRLSVSFMDKEHVESALSTIKDRAQEFDLQPIHSNYSGLITDPLSYTVEKGVLNFIIHTTLRQTKLLTLYKFMSVPMPLSGGRTVIPKIEKPFLAVTPSLQEHIIMSHDDIKNCKKIKDIFICNNMLTFKHMAQSCIGSLYKNLKSFILHNCEFTDIQSFRETIIQISDTKLLVIVPPGHSISSYTSCGDFESTSEQTLLRDSVYIEVKPGCTFSTDNYVFRSIQTYQISDKFLIRNIPNFTLDIDTSKIKNISNILPTDFHHYPAIKDNPDESLEHKDPYIEIGAVVIVFAFLTIAACNLLVCVPGLRHRIADLFSTLRAALGRGRPDHEHHEPPAQRDHAHALREQRRVHQRSGDLGSQQSLAGKSDSAVSRVVEAISKSPGDAEASRGLCDTMVAQKSIEQLVSPSGGCPNLHQEDRHNLSIEFKSRNCQFPSDRKRKREEEEESDDETQLP